MAAEDLILGVGADIGSFGGQMDKASASIDKFEGHTRKAEGSGGSFIGSLLGGAGKIASFVTPLGAASTLIGGLTDIIKDQTKGSSDWNAAMAQTDAILKSTGGQAGVTKDQVESLAGSLSAGNGLSTAADDAIASGENLLLTFTGIGKDVFPKTTQTMLDMTAAMNHGDVSSEAMKGTAIQLGKALNDPMMGMSALTKVGVTFSEQQKAQITTMEKAGDVAGAQGVILNELGKEFGGSALAGTKSLGGQMTILTEKFNSVAGTVGDALLPAVTSGMSFLSSPAVMGVIENLATALGTGLTQGLQLAGQVFQTVAPYVKPLIDNIVGFFTAISNGAPFLQSFGDLVGAQFGQIGNIAGALLGAVQGALPGIISSIGQWASSFVSWVGPMIPPLLAKMGEMAGQLFNWLTGTALPAIVQKLGQWGSAFVAWVGPQIPPLLAKLGELAGQLWTWLTGTALPAIITKLGQWGQAFVAWIGPMIPPMLAKAGELLGGLAGWLITTGLPTIVGKLVEWGGALIGWIAPQIPPLLVKLGELLLSLGGWIITTALPAIVGKLVEWGGAFLGFIAKDVIPKLPGALGAIVTTIGGWVTGAITGIVTEAGRIGKGLIDGIISGLAGLGTRMFDSIKGMIGGAIDDVKNFFGIHSPSDHTEKEVGKPLGEGIAAGITGTQSTITTAFQNAVTGGLPQIVTFFKTALDKESISSIPGLWKTSFDNMFAHLNNAWIPQTQAVIKVFFNNVTGYFRDYTQSWGQYWSDFWGSLAVPAGPGGSGGGGGYVGGPGLGTNGGSGGSGGGRGSFGASTVGIPGSVGGGGGIHIHPGAIVINVPVGANVQTVSQAVAIGVSQALATRQESVQPQPSVVLVGLPA